MDISASDAAPPVQSGGTSIAAELVRADRLAVGGDADAALRIWAELRTTQQQPPIAAWSHAGKLLCRLRRFDEADAILDDARRRFPDRAEVWSGWADNARARRDWPETR